LLPVNAPKAEERIAFVAWGAVHWFGHIAAVTVSALIGWVVITVIGAFVPSGGALAYWLPFCLVSAIIGYKLNGRYGHTSALWVWMPFLLWFALGAAELLRAWNPSWSHQSSRWDYAALNLFSDQCGSTECLYEAMFTSPLVSSIAYAIGAWFGARRRGAMQ
jgi:hypothetical protein